MNEADELWTGTGNEFQEEEDSASYDAEDDRRSYVDGEGFPRSLNSVLLQSKIVKTGTLKAAGTIIEQLNLTTSSGIVDPVVLSIRHFEARSPEELDCCETELIFEDEQVEELGSRLEEKRLLIVSGEPESGKGSMALLVASRLSRKLGLKGQLANQGLDSALQVDLDTIATSKAFGQRIVTFEDALAGENPDLSRFLKTIDGFRLTTLSERLRKNGSAVLLTAAPESLAPFEKNLERLGILIRSVSPSRDLRRLALHRFASRLPLSGAPADFVAAWLDEKEEELIQKLDTIPKMARFTHEYLTDVVDGKLTLRQALERMDDLSQWLLTDLADDLEALATVLAIVLCSAVPPAAGVPWFSFISLRERLVETMRRKLRSPSDESPSPRYLAHAPSFLERARAHVIVIPASLSEVVRFRDDRYPALLWRAILGPAREIATMLEPLLQELTKDADAFIRTSAARALGRLGQMSPAHLATPILQRWTHEKSTPDDLLAFFLQGAVASEDEGYRCFCLARLRHLACHEQVEVASRAILGLRLLLGRPDPVVPLRELRQIAEARLPIQLAALRRVEQDVIAEEEKIRQRLDLRQVAQEMRVLHAQGHAFMNAALVPKENLILLGAVQHSLAGVLFSQGGDPGPVLEELRDWMKSEPEKLAPLVAYLFLHRRGLIDLLDRHKWIDASSGMEPCSRFLLSASRGDTEMKNLTDFLERVFRSLRVFPGLFNSLLEERFLQVLRAWSQEGCKVIRLRPVVLQLYSNLLASSDSHLRQVIHRFLKTDQHFAARGSRLRALALDALAGNRGDPAPVVGVRPRRPGWLGKQDDRHDRE
jgi:hypothetical protein